MLNIIYALISFRQKKYWINYVVKRMKVILRILYYLHYGFMRCIYIIYIHRYIGFRKRCPFVPWLYKNTANEKFSTQILLYTTTIPTFPIELLHTKSRLIDVNLCG